MFLVIESCYSDKLAHVQILINCRYSVAQMCTCEDTLAHILGAPYFDNIMSYNSLTTFQFLRLAFFYNHAIPCNDVIACYFSF